MPTYRIKDPISGQTLKITGDSIPTEGEIAEIFAQHAKSAGSAMAAAAGSLADGSAGNTIRSAAALAGHPMPTSVPEQESFSALGALKEVPGVLNDFRIGAGKGIASTVTGLGEMAHSALFSGGGPAEGKAVDAGMDVPAPNPELDAEAFRMAREAAVPTGGVQALGKGVEQTAEFFALPEAKLGTAGKAVVRGVTNAGLAKAQGATTGEALTAGALASLPVSEAVKYVGDKLHGTGNKLVRSALKPTVAAMRKISGSNELDAKAESLVNFIVDNKITTPDKAAQIMKEAEGELQRALSLKNAPTDAPQRALRYLDALEKQAKKAGLGEDVAAIRRAGEEVFASNMAETVDDGIRALRTNMSPAETLDLARTRGRLQNRKAYGELKSTAVEASKAIERAGRDAVKAAVPEATPLLAREGKAIQAKEVLDRMRFRQANRDAVGLVPGVMSTTGAVTGGLGGAAILGAAASWLRNNELKAGMWANSLGKAIKSGNAPLVADIMKKIAVSRTPRSEAQ